MTLDQILKRIDSFSELEKGWLGEGDGEPISKETIELAKKIAKVLPQSSDKDGQWFPAPTSEGSIQFEAGNEEIEVWGFAE